MNSDILIPINLYQMIKGCTVDIKGFHRVVYQEHKHVLYMEIDAREPVVEVDYFSIDHWEAPYQDEAISEEDRKRIMKNVYTILKMMLDHKNVKIIDTRKRG